MDILTNPAILFFIFGIFAGLIKSNLEIPQQIAKFLSLYLLMAIGLKGGVALATSGFTMSILSVIIIGLFLSILVPIYSYHFLKRYLNGYDAAATAATYGSISAVTFVTATQFLTAANIAYDGFMSAVMAIMESPAIIIAVLLANRLRNNNTTSLNDVLKDSFTEGANLLLLASLLIGYIAGPVGYTLMSPFTATLFTGLLAFFLLDMGIQVAKNLPSLRGKNPALLAYAIIAPIIHALVALSLCVIFGVSLGNTVLMMVLVASASYIAVPAAVKHSIPEASPSVYLGLSLGVTFTFNVIFGIPLYYWLATIFI